MKKMKKLNKEERILLLIGVLVFFVGVAYGYWLGFNDAGAEREFLKASIEICREGTYGKLLH